MEIHVHKENLSEHDIGGGYRDVVANIWIDETLSPGMQRKALIYEVLGAMLDYAFTHDQLEDISGTLNDALDQLGWAFKPDSGRNP